MERLNDNLQSNISNNRVWPAGIAGSDMHWIYYGYWGNNMTYSYLYPDEVVNKTNLHNAMRQGRTVASTDGTLTSFFVIYGGTERHVGSVVGVPSGTTVTLRGRAIPASG